MTHNAHQSTPPGQGGDHAGQHDSESLRRFEDFRWETVPVHPYKTDATSPFRDITRQILFDSPDLAAQLRYFEIAANGYSTLERHEHVHGVMILRGSGEALVGGSVLEVAPYALVYIPPLTWHQFRANRGEPLGFLCMVNAQRDKPQLPTDAELRVLRADPAIVRFLETP